jgi:hypothetical protein
MPDWKPGDFVAGPGGGRVESPDWEPPKQELNVRSVAAMIGVLILVGLLAIVPRSSTDPKTEETQWSEIQRPVLTAMFQYRTAEINGDRDAMARIVSTIRSTCDRAYSLREPKRERVKVQRNDTLTACSAMKLG